MSIPLIYLKLVMVFNAIEHGVEVNRGVEVLHHTSASQVLLGLAVHQTHLDGQQNLLSFFAVNAVIQAPARTRKHLGIKLKSHAYDKIMKYCCIRQNLLDSFEIFHVP